MQVIDAHQHFWNYDPVRDAWIGNDMSVLKKDYLPQDLSRILTENNINGTVVVQASQTLEETRFLLSLSAEYEFIKGIVGWVDIRSDDLKQQLTEFKTNKKLKGFRHILQAETDRTFMLHPEFLKGLRLLFEYGYTYDILIYKDQLKYLPALVSKFPDQKFLLDHMAKPDIKMKDLKEWQRDLQPLKQFPNLYCKLSGLVTEADWKKWKMEDFKDYLDVAIDVFGINRVMFGSDWPVCLLAATYKDVLNICKEYFSGFSKEEQEKVFSSNAITFYNL
jgi:L-fuconolactonase